MDLLFNELSANGSFSSVEQFSTQLHTLMALRSQAGKYGVDIFCNRSVLNQKITAEKNFFEAIQELNQNQKRAILLWLDKSGPFWDDNRQHSEGEYFSVNGEVVTDSALAEAAYREDKNLKTQVVSFDSLKWKGSPIKVNWQINDASSRLIDVHNHVNSTSLEIALQDKENNKPMKSWLDLKESSQRMFFELTISPIAFQPMERQPFSRVIAEAIWERLHILNALKKDTDSSNHKRGNYGNQLYQKHFTGDEAWFSDSSSTEKSKFKSDLTFPHPEDESREVFCPMHGKIKHQQIRIHFSWPIEDKLYIVYIGPKITKR